VADIEDVTKPPRDLSVVGCDEIGFAVFATPAARQYRRSASHVMSVEVPRFAGMM